MRQKHQPDCRELLSVEYQPRRKGREVSSSLLWFPYCVLSPGEGVPDVQHGGRWTLHSQMAWVRVKWWRHSLGKDSTGGGGNNIQDGHDPGDGTGGWQTQASHPGVPTFRPRREQPGYSDNLPQFSSDPGPKGSGEGPRPQRGPNCTGLAPPGPGPRQPQPVWVLVPAPAQTSLSHLLTSVAPWASIQSRSWPAAIMQWMSVIMRCSGAARISLIFSWVMPAVEERGSVQQSQA